MADEKTVEIRITAKNLTDKELSSVRLSLAGIRGEARAAHADVGLLSSSFTKAKEIMLGFVGAEAILGGVRAAFGFAKDAAIGMNATLETSTLQFETLMGDADGAKAHVQGLFEFAKKTPFETGPIIEASRLMRTFGGDALDTKKNLTLIGDASAATGAPINELGMWVGRLYANLQAGKPIGEAAQRLGELAVLSPQARMELEAMAGAGKSADEVFGRFQDQLGRFGGAMEKQASTWEGVVSTFSDTAKMVVAEAAQPLFGMLRDGLKSVNAWMEENEATIQRWQREAGDAIRGVAGFIKDDLWPAAKDIGEAIGGVLQSGASFVRWLNGLPGPVKDAALTVGGLATAIWAVNTALGALGVSSAAGALAKITGGLESLTGLIARIPGGAATLAGALGVGLTSGLLSAATAGEDFSSVQNSIATVLGRSGGIVDQSRQGMLQFADSVTVTAKVTADGTNKFQAYIDRIKAEADAQKEAAKERKRALKEAAEAEREWAARIYADHERVATSQRLIGNGLVLVRTATTDLALNGVRDIGQLSQGFDKFKNQWVSTAWQTEGFATLPPVVKDAREYMSEFRESLATPAWKEHAKGLGQIGDAFGGIGRVAEMAGHKTIAAVAGIAQTTIQAFAQGGPVAGAIAGITAAFAAIGDKLFKAEGKKVNDLRDDFIAAAGGLHALNVKAHDAGMTLDALLKAKTVKDYEKAIQDLESAFAAQNSRLEEQKRLQGDIADLEGRIQAAREKAIPTWSEMSGLMEKYGISLGSVGQAAQQIGITDQATEILNDFERIKAGSGDVGGFIGGMGDEIAGLVLQAKQYGVELPENLKPLAEELIRQGKLVDENGTKLEDLSGVKFGAPVETETERATLAMQGMVDQLKELVETLKGLPGIARDVATGLVDNLGTAPWEGWSLPEFPELGRPEYATGGEGYATGTNGQYVSFGYRRRVDLHGDEAVVPRSGSRSLADDIAARLNRGAGRTDNRAVVAGLSAVRDAVSRLERSIANQPRDLARTMRDALILARA